MDTQYIDIMTIGDLVRRYQVAPQSLRNWEAQGIIPPARRTPGGHRRYGNEHVAALDKLFGLPPTASQTLDVQPAAPVTAQREGVGRRDTSRHDRQPAGGTRRSARPVDTGNACTPRADALVTAV